MKEGHVAGIVALAVAGAAVTFLLQPIIAPFLWAVALSVPLHRTKKRAVESLLGLGKEEEKEQRIGASMEDALDLLWGSILKFAFGPFSHMVGSMLRMLSVRVASLASKPIHHAHDQNDAVIPATISQQMTEQVAPVDDSKADSSETDLKTRTTTATTTNIISAATMTTPTPAAAPVAHRNSDSVHWTSFLIASAIRATLISMAWNGSAFLIPLLATVLACSAGWGLLSSAFSNYLRKPRDREFWNVKVTTFYIWLWTLSVLSISGFFVYRIVAITPQMTGALLELLAKESVPYSPHSGSIFPPVLPEFGIRQQLLSYKSDVRSLLLSHVQSKLDSAFPQHNLTAQEAALVGLGGWHVYEQTFIRRPSASGNTNGSTMSDVFRSRFPQTTEAIVHLAKGNHFSALVALGPAIGEIRWMGPSALSHTIEHFDPLGISKESLDPSGSIPGLLGPSFIDTVFWLLVFYSSLWVLVHSDGGVHYYVAQLIGDNLTDALLVPLDRSIYMNAQLILCRLMITQIVAALLLPTSSGFLAAVTPAVAFMSSWAPAVPPILTMTLPTVFLVFVLHGTPVRALAVLVIHLWYIGTIEPLIIRHGMGTDGISILDDFAIWMGWFALGSPVGLILGPVAFISLRAIYRNLVVD